MEILYGLDSLGFDHWIEPKVLKKIDGFKSLRIPEVISCNLLQYGWPTKAAMICRCLECHHQGVHMFQHQMFLGIFGDTLDQR